MNIIFITNNNNYIEQYYNDAVLYNSILTAREHFDDVSYIILDEANISIEGSSFKVLNKYKNKVLIIGYSQYDNFISVSPDEFYIEDIKMYFDKPNLNNEEEVDFNVEINSLLNDYINNEVSIAEVEKGLRESEYSLREQFYSYLSIIGDDKLMELPNRNIIKLDYNIYLIKNKVKNNIQHITPLK